MKQGLLKSFSAGIVDREHGEQYGSIFRYLIPELITALLIYSLPYWIDSFFISQLDATAYPTVGGVNNLIHFFVKLAEGFSVGTVIVSGQLCGKQEYDRVGQAFRSFFWSTAVFAAVVAIALYIGAPSVLRWYGFPEDMIVQGMPFLRLRTVSIVFIFLFLVCVGFLRGVKNTRVPMLIYIAGSGAKFSTIAIGFVIVETPKKGSYIIRDATGKKNTAIECPEDCCPAATFSCSANGSTVDCATALKGKLMVCPCTRCLAHCPENCAVCPTGDALTCPATLCPPRWIIPLLQ